MQAVKTLCLLSILISMTGAAETVSTYVREVGQNTATHTWSCTAECKNNSDQYSRTVVLPTIGGEIQPPANSVMDSYCSEQGGVSKIKCRVTSIDFERDAEVTQEVPVTTTTTITRPSTDLAPRTN